MPAPYALAQHAALADVATALVPGEAVLAFLDGTYIVCSFERVAPLHGAFSDALWARARVQLNQGKIRVWNAAGQEPPISPPSSHNMAAMFELGRGARRRNARDWSFLAPPSDPQLFCDRTCRRSAASTTPSCSASRPLPTCRRLGSSCCFALRLAATTPSACFRRTPLPSMLGSMIRLLRPVSVRCSTETLSRRCRPQLLRQLNFGYGGFGLGSAGAAAPAAYWASWQDSLPALLACLSDRSRAAPREFERTARRHAPCPYNGMLSCSRGRTGRLPHAARFPTPLWGESSAAPVPQLAQAAEET